MNLYSKDGDHLIPVTRLCMDRNTGTMIEAPPKALFVRGPIPLAWLSLAAEQPGKTLHVAMAIRWLHGMSPTAPIKLTKKATDLFHISRDAVSDGLQRLESLGLITVQRRPGQKSTVNILENPKSKQLKAKSCRS